GVRKRGYRYQLDMNYTAASSATYTMFHGDANGGVPNEWNNWGTAERGPSDFHQRHRLAANGTVNLPFGSRGCRECSPCERTARESVDGHGQQWRYLRCRPAGRPGPQFLPRSGASATGCVAAEVLFSLRAASVRRARGGIQSSQPRQLHHGKQYVWQYRRC